MNDPLDELFVSGKELDRELLGTVLKPFLRIDQDSLTIIPKENWHKLAAEAKIILFLTARRAIKAFNLHLENEDASPSEIEAETGLKGNTIRPILKRLLEQKIISQPTRGRYLLPNYSIPTVKELSSKWLQV